MESLWLLTRAWNTGILLYSLAQYPEAEKWCGLGISFIRHLGSLQESYQTQVQEPGRRGLRGWGRVREMSEAELEVVATVERDRGGVIPPHIGGRWGRGLTSTDKHRASEVYVMTCFNRGCRSVGHPSDVAPLQRGTGQVGPSQEEPRHGRMTRLGGGPLHLG